MCFSATVSFSASVGLSLLGIATIRQIASKRELLLASFPCLFALQQALEGIVWLGKTNSSFSQIDAIDAYGYGFLLFATFIWLVLSPLSIYLLEEDSKKSKFLLGLTAVGLLLGIYLFSSIVDRGIKPEIFSGNLLYDLRFIPFYEVSKYIYLAIISLPFAIAQHSLLKLFSGLVIISFIFSQLFFQMTFVSVWCFFAAILSGFLCLTMKDLSADRIAQI
jgi:hypothetical protein